MNASYHRTKYKRLVNCVYPVNPSDGLRRNEMTKLCFYVITQPQKLDRVFDYVSKKIHQFMRHKRDRPFVHLSLSVIDELMTVSCGHITLFVDVYLTNLNRLLENSELTSDTKLLLAVIQSFEHFCSIREDTLNLERSYQPFIDCFANLARGDYSANKTDNMEFSRQCGLRGLTAIVRKLSNDDNQLHLWSILPTILPSVMLNLHQKKQNTSTTIAEKVFCDILSRVHGSTQLATCLMPVFSYLDKQHLWADDAFCCHKLLDLIYQNVPAAVSVSIVSFLVNQVEQHLQDDVRSSILRLCRYCLSQSNSDFLGSHIYTCLRQLCTYLKHAASQADEDFEQDLVETIVCLALCSNKRTTTSVQTVESVVFLLNEALSDGFMVEDQHKLQFLFLSAIMRILSESTLHADAMVPSLCLFEPLMTLLESEHADIRFMSFGIVAEMLDRDGKLACETRAEVKSLEDRVHLLSNITAPKKSISVRISDAEFINRFGDAFIGLVEKHLLNDKLDQQWFDLLLVLCVLFYREYIHEATVLGRLLTFCFHVQDKARTCHLHGFVAALLGAISSMSLQRNHAFPVHYINAVIDERKRKSPQMLSLKVHSHSDSKSLVCNNKDYLSLLFDSSKIDPSLLTRSLVKEQRIVAANYVQPITRIALSSSLLRGKGDETDRHSSTLPLLRPALVKTPVPVVTVNQIKMALMGQSTPDEHRLVKSHDRRLDFEDEYVLSKWANATDFFNVFRELNDDRPPSQYDKFPRGSDAIMCAKFIINILDRPCKQHQVSKRACKFGLPQCPSRTFAF